MVIWRGPWLGVEPPTTLPLDYHGGRIGINLEARKKTSKIFSGWTHKQYRSLLLCDDIILFENIPVHFQLWNVLVSESNVENLMLSDRMSAFVLHPLTTH